MVEMAAGFGSTRTWAAAHCTGVDIVADEAGIVGIVGIAAAAAASAADYHTDNPEVRPFWFCRCDGERMGWMCWNRLRICWSCTG
jgi:hypothetical protein